MFTKSKLKRKKEKQGKLVRRQLFFCLTKWLGLGYTLFFSFLTIVYLVFHVLFVYFSKGFTFQRRSLA